MLAARNWSSLTMPSGHHSFAGPPSPGFTRWFDEAAARIYADIPERAARLGDDLVRLGDAYPYEVAAAHLGDDALTPWRPTTWQQWALPVLLTAVVGTGLVMWFTAPE